MLILDVTKEIKTFLKTHKLKLKDVSLTLQGDGQIIVKDERQEK